MKFSVITIFPELVSHYCSETILGRAQKKKKIKVNAINLRDFATDKHQKVDDTPYGGGAGMVMKPEPIYRALKKLRALAPQHPSTPAPQHKIKSKRVQVLECSGAQVKKTVLLSPRGRQFDQRVAEEWSKLKEITFVCGRYEGVDQRVADYMVDEEISVGPYVLAGGELGALIIIEAVSRLIPGVLGNEESLLEETFNSPQPPSTPAPQNKIKSKRVQVLECSGAQVEYPQYTKPETFMKMSVPEVLLSGDHKKIKDWRQNIRI